MALVLMPYDIAAYQRVDKLPKKWRWFRRRRLRKALAAIQMANNHLDTRPQDITVSFQHPQRYMCLILGKLYRKSKIKRRAFNDACLLVQTAIDKCPTLDIYLATQRVDVSRETRQKFWRTFIMHLTQMVNA